jgi:hypothetical protein
LEHFYFPIYWEFHHPNWRTPSFFRGVGQPPTSSLSETLVQYWISSCCCLRWRPHHCHQNSD